MLHCTAQHAAQLRIAGRRQQGHARNLTQESNIKYAVMCRTVFSDNARAVNTQNNRHMINRHIVNELVICTLQKCRIQRANRTQALFCHAGSHRDGVFLRNADIEKAIAIQLRKYA